MSEMTKMEFTEKLFKLGGFKLEFYLDDNDYVICSGVRCEDYCIDSGLFNVCSDIYGCNILTPNELEEFYTLFPEARLV